MIDLSYLNKFKGIGVRVDVQTDPKYSQESTRGQTKGLLVRSEDRGITLAKGETNLGELVTLTTTLYMPYLGSTVTLWTIQTLDSLVLLTHKRIGENSYKVLGPEEIELGEIRGLEIPYNTIWSEIQKMTFGKNGEAYTRAIQERSKKFQEWRKSLFVDPIQQTN